MTEYGFCKDHDHIIAESVECPWCEIERLRDEKQAVIDANAFEVCSLKGRIEELEEVLEFALEAPGEIHKIMRDNDLIIDDLDDRMQKLAFTIYTNLVEVSKRADFALGKEKHNG